MITRSFARILRTVLRQCFANPRQRNGPSTVLLRADAKGLHAFATCGDMSVAHDQPGPRPTDLMVVTSDVLKAVEGSDDGSVSLELVRGEVIRAKWHDGSGTRTIELPSAPLSEVKDLRRPAEWSPVPPEFLSAFVDAADTSSQDATRFAVNCVQLRGKAGEVLGTDGQWLYIHAGFRFPFEEDVLVPRFRAFGADGLIEKGEVVAVARDDEYLFVRAGRWTFRLVINQHGQFPDVDSVVPRPSMIVSRIEFSEEDVGHLLRQVPKSPGPGDRPLTLELGEQPVLRFHAGEHGSPVSIELASAKAEGQKLRLCLDHGSFRRILQLGFREIHVTSPERPIVCRDGKRLFVVMPKDPSLAIDPSQIDTAHLPTRPSAVPKLTDPEERSPTHMRPNPVTGPTSNHTENGNGHASPPPGIPELLAEAEQVRSVLQDAGNRLARLISGLRQNRKQGQAVRAAVASLRQLKLEG